MKKNFLLLALLTVLLPAGLGAQSAWLHPGNDFKMKTWWFFGYERTTREGIMADVKALRDAGFGGVVYYDQNHAQDATANGAEDAFTPSWWEHLRFAAEEAGRAGLSFEVNISNGYCAGGSWIDAAHAMKRVVSAETSVPGGKELSLPLPEIIGADGYVQDIAVLAFPVRDSLTRHITARYYAKGKGRNGAMQGPLATGEEFSGYGFSPLPEVGVLQVSGDSLNWRDVVSLAPMYSSQGGYFFRTTAFPAAAGKYWRVAYPDGTFSYDGQDTGSGLRQWHTGSAAKLDRWEELAGLHSDFDEGDRTPAYMDNEILSPKDIIDLSACVENGRLHCTLPDGSWTVLRLAAVPTGARTKHGRQNLLGYECDKLSEEAAILHWESYAQVILDSLNSPGRKLVSGITMDSHEGGAQNWTAAMLSEFRSRRGYDFTPWLPLLAGYVVESAERSRQVLYDYRHTIAELIRDNYFGTFQKLASRNGVSFTAQAIGNALCITGDAISVKQVVEKPQGEFWTYQQQGAYDIKDCSSAAHLYGKPIASAEAMTDCEYKDSPSDLHRVANIAFSMGAQEFVVCATPHIPEAKVKGQYIAGREYAINRSNPKWKSMKPVWLQAARSMVMLREGKAAPDVLVFLGDDVPVKTLTNRLPAGLEGLDWDVCTADALRNRLRPEGGRLVTPDGVSYKALIIGRQAHMTPQTRSLVDSLHSAGVPVLSSAESIVRPLVVSQGEDSVVHIHRRTEAGELFYLASTRDRLLRVSFRLQDAPGSVTVWNNRNGRRRMLKASRDGSFSLRLGPVESVFITY